MIKYLRWIVTVGWCCHLAKIACEPIDDHLAKGYYAFEEASALYKTPPTVRKPPYVRIDASCPGSIQQEKFSPKDALCGDLNKGLIPRNPMGQLPLRQPYPFELIRNKTLEFLSQTLPFLKKDSKIPKVARYVKSQESLKLRKPPGGYGFPKVPFHYRDRRSVKINTTENNGKNMSEVKTIINENVNVTKEVNSTIGDYRGHNPCQGGSGIWCTLSNIASNSNLPLAVLKAVAQGLSASGSTATTTTPKPWTIANNHLDSGESVAHIALKLLSSLVGQKAQSNSVKTTESNVADSNPSPVSQAISLLVGESDENTNMASLVLKMLSDRSFLNLFSNVLPSRRRRPTSEEIPIDTPGNYAPIDDGRLQGLPPTPCPSTEEYVTPIFARNYQGVWKYVVQIPQEGYFTQTVQQTQCIRGRCDFMDGICHESPRWVSLLVAEIFYPDAYFPTKSPVDISTEVPPVEDFDNFQQYLRRRVGESDASTSYNYYQQYPSSGARKKNNSKHCDGYDNAGCYVVRLYYDWFLINGSCKCWKPNAKNYFVQN